MPLFAARIPVLPHKLPTTPGKNDPLRPSGESFLLALLASASPEPAPGGKNQSGTEDAIQKIRPPTGG
ncbi:hypothetical protein ABME00_21885 [Citrobacter amalonaticus]|uniref:hypothetical protein n=1 Tax=Citrobacter amalonaticus TaxID=35703 RepID=UPI0018A99112|nr:hypothetical protein [Citrobacter amalonaticus]MDT7072472.1 hypothetical protein [Citrobacter amalonaticus]HCW3116578.1 hypothetical protein [Citrobacter amalonaticus]HEM7867456.1 hypothetical protein [Citrobacter amalonaticus]